MEERDQQFVEYVVKAIVDNPDKVVVKRSVDEMGVLLELGVDPADMGKIIGKDGRTAKAVRTLLRVLGAQNHSRVNLKIMEPEGGTGGNRHVDMSSSSEEHVDMPETTSKDELGALDEE